MLISNRIFSLLLSVLVVQQIVAQSLTISTTGQTGTSGTNWSISSNVLTVSGTATIAASVIENHLSFNSLSIQGNSTSFAVNVSQSITSSATGNGLTIGAASNTGNISMNNTVSLAGPMTIFGGRVSIMEAFAIAGSNNLSITSINTVIAGTAIIGGSASISASGNFILGTNITAGTGFPLTAPGGFTKTGAGTSYLFSNINTTNTAVSLAGPVTVGNFNTSNAITQINTDGGNISIPGAVSAYSGTGREYMALVYANLYDATGGAVTGSTTDIYLRFNAGNQSFIGLPGMPATFSMQYLLIAGGGAGGGSNIGVFSGGGGGGGGVADGLLTFASGTPLSLVIGSGGVGVPNYGNVNGLNGGDTGFSELGFWVGGGGGGGGSDGYNGNIGTGNNNVFVAGRSYLAGGGGGGSGRGNGNWITGGTGTQYPTSGQGTATSYGPGWWSWGGGGGGASGNGYYIGDLSRGGIGRSNSITGSSVEYGAGSGARDRTNTIGSGGTTNTSDVVAVNGSNGAVILRFALSSALDAASLSTAFHLNATAGSVTLGSTVANLSAIEITAGIASSITGPITGTGSLLKTGSGALTLSGDNRYTGGTTVTTGTLLLNDSSPDDGQGVIVGALNINLNGTVQLTGNPSALGWNTFRVTTININEGVLEALSGQQHIWNLTGGLNFNGGGTLRSNGGTSAAAATSYFEWGVTNITVTNPTSSAEIAGRINLRSDLGGVVFTVADGTAANDLLISAAITETSAPTLTKTGAGKLTFTGVNNYTGVTTVSAGTLQIGNGGTLGTISAGAVTNNAALIFNRSDNFTISNVISGTGTVTKTGVGTLTLSGANTYTGLSTISQGTLKCGSATALGTVAGSSTIVAGAALDLNGLNYSTAEPLTINGTGASASSGVIYNSTATAATFSGPITLASNTTINGTAGDLTLSGAINGAFALEIISTNKAFSQTGIVGGTTPPVSYTINTGTGLITKNAAATVAGLIAFDGGELSLSSSTSSTLANAAIIARSKTYIKNASATSFTTQGGDVLLAANIDDATDSESTNNGYIQFLLGGLTVTTNGGNITLGGSDALASGYAMGNNVSGSYEGIRVDGTLNLNSGGGNIVLRGKSYAVNSSAARWALGFWALTTGSINSGIGTILLDGFSQSSGSAYSSALYNNGAITITSANTTADAIRMIGKATGASLDAWGIEANSALSVLATGDGGGITISTSQQSSTTYDAVFRGVTNILAKSGPIQLLGKQDGGIANGKWYTGADFYLGSKASTTVPTSSSNVTIQYDRFEFSGTRNIATTGSVTFQPASTSFGQEVLTSWFNWNQNGQTMTGLTIGKLNNTADVTHQTNIITAAGPITAYGGDITISQNLTSTLSGADILLQATGAINLSSSRTIQTSGGDVILNASSGGTATAASSAIYLYVSSQILSNGGNITLGGGYSGTEGNLYAATNITNGGYAIILDNSTINALGGHIKIYGNNVSSYGDGVYLNEVAISSTGAGTIGIYGDSYGGYNGTQFFGGITFNNFASTIQTVNGNLTLKGVLTNSQHVNGFAINFYRSPGTTGQTKHIQILSQTGDIQITADRGTSIGQGIGHSSWGHIYFGSPLNNSYTASGDIKFTYSNLVNAVNNGLKVKTTGAVTYEPAANSFIAAQTLPPNATYTLAESASSLTIGKPNNTANITCNAAQTVAGPISIYAGTITLNAGLTTTNNGAISFYSDNAIAGLSSPRTVTASGAMNFIPQSASFGAVVTYPIANLNVTSTGLLIGKTTNVANVTFGNTTSINGPITVYGGTVALNENISSSANSTISLYANALTIASGKTITSGGQLIITPQSASTTIGIAGASGTLALPLSYFSTNFTDGFSNIQIGRNEHTAAISSNAFTLRDNMTFLTSGSLTLGGLPIMGSNNVTLGSAISSFSGMPTYYFQTNGTGKVIRSLSNTSTLQFPIGNSSYNPVSITNNSGSADDFSVRVLDAVYLNGTSGSVVSTPVVNRTWDISKTNVNAGTGVGLVFNWNTGEVANGSLTNPYLNHHTGSVWEIPTVASTAFGTNMFTVVGYTGTFSPFTVAEGASALPVEMVYFYANCAEGDVELNWQTASEHNSDSFQLETSLDAVNWEIVQTIPAAGFSQELLNYSAVDQDAARNKKYYRLKQVDFNGEFEMYGPLKADCAVESSDISLYPNPCETQVTVSVASQISTELNYTLISPEGKVLENKQMAVQSGMTAFTLDVSGYPSGMYILQFDLNDKRFIKKLTVQ